MPESPIASSSALTSKNFRIYLYGNTVSVLGIWIQRLAIGWQAWELSESSVIVGLVAAGQFLPMLLLTPLFGVWVDRIRPRYGAIVMHFVFLAIAFVLSALTFTGQMSIEILVALSFLHGLANSAYAPIRLALVPDLVPQHQFPSAVAISSLIFNTSRFVGPGLAGAIVTFFGLGYAYLINGITYLPVVVALMMIRTHHRKKEPGGKTGYFEQLAEGLNYTRNHPAIRHVILIAGVSTFFGRSVLELMPAFAALIFAGGSDTLAILMAAAGAGAIATSVALSVWNVQDHLPQIVVAGAVGVSVTILLFAVSDNLIAGIVAVSALGMFSTMVSVGSQSEVQIKVDNALRGRVMSLWSLVLIGGPAIGSIVAGWLAAEIGSSNTLFVFSVTCFIFVIIGGRPRQTVGSVS